MKRTMAFGILRYRNSCAQAVWEQSVYIDGKVPLALAHTCFAFFSAWE